MSEEQKNNHLEDDDLERFVPDGVFAIPAPKDIPRYNIAKLVDYCESKGIKPKELSEEERKMFELPPRK